MKYCKFVDFNSLDGIELMNQDLSKFSISVDSIYRIKYACLSEHFLELLCNIDDKMETVSITDVPENKLCQILEL